METNRKLSDPEPEITTGPAIPRTGDTAPEVSPGTENLTAWDEPVDQRGYRHPTVPMGDEDIVSDLVAEGLEEADRETRLAARDEMDEDEDLKAEDDRGGDDEDDYPVTGITS